MEQIFYPKSVVILGVSTSPFNLGRVIVENMDRFRFSGTIYLVGGKEGTLVGRKIYQSVEDLPEVPDLAVFLIPAASIALALEACGRKGIKGIIIQTGGFSEFVDDRTALEGEILHIAAHWGLKIVGPNCVGIVNRENGLVLPFYPLRAEESRLGPIAFLSQSGGLIHDVMTLCHMENLGVGKLVSMGNKIALDENDFLEYLLADPKTSMVGMYLENIKDGRRLMELAASSNKPVILVKANRNPGSSEIARFHTSALAGDDQVVDAAARQAGIIRVQSIKEMIDCFKAFSQPILKGRRLAVMARSGGHAVLAADSVHHFGFELAKLSEDVFDVIRSKRKAGVTRMTNPLDLGDVFDIDTYARVAVQALKEENVDGVFFIHSYAAVVDSEATKSFIRTMADISRAAEKPVIFCTIAHEEDWYTLKNVSDLPIFTYIDEALKAYSRSLEHYGNCRKEAPRSGLAVGRGMSLQDRSPLPAGMLPVGRGFELLSAQGLRTARFRIVNGPDDGLRAAGELGYPVALKDASPGMLHRTEKGGVILGIKDEAELRRAFDKIRTDTWMLQEMAHTGCEVIIGGRRDNEFGPVVLCGLGGIFVELFRDISLRVAPVDVAGAGRMIEELKGAKILNGFRGGPVYDTDYLAEAVSRVSMLLKEHPEIKTLDINPLILLPKGEGGVVVDVKVEVD